MSRENFSTLSFDYYSDEQKNPATGLSALATAKLAVTNCHEFIDNFENKPKNIFSTVIPVSERLFYLIALQKSF